MSDGAATKTSAVEVRGIAKHQAVCQRVLLLYKLMKNILWKVSWNKLGTMFVKISVVVFYFNLNEKAEIFSWPGIWISGFWGGKVERTERMFSNARGSCAM